MSDLSETLTEAFDHTDYDVRDVSVNRSQIRVALLPEGADPDELRTIVKEAVGTEQVFGLTVTTETIDARDTVGTVVSFRYRD